LGRKGRRGQLEIGKKGGAIWIKRRRTKLGAKETKGERERLNKSGKAREKTHERKRQVPPPTLEGRSIKKRINF